MAFGNAVPARASGASSSPAHPVACAAVAFALDTSSEFGNRVARRLRDEPIAWLTTVSARGAPTPSPVWFLWDGASLLVYSRPDTAKLRNIEHNPRVAVHLEGNGRGGDIVILTGDAQLSDDPPAHHVPAYVEKYGAFIARNGWTPESFAADYSVPVRIRPARLRGH
jgi:PPOX class probable F420-dependent enzyme